MAELLIKIGGSSSDPRLPQDGDIVAAYNDRRIGAINASHICHPRLGKRNADGLLVRGTITEDWFALTHRYRYERVSFDEAIKVDLWNPDSKPELHKTRPGRQIPLYFWRKLHIQLPGMTIRKPYPIVFGEIGREVVYVGKTDYSKERIDAIWERIEANTPERRENHRLRKLGKQEMLTFLPVSVDDFDDEAAIAYETPVFALDDDGEIIEEGDERRPVIVQYRQFRMEWRELMPADIPPHTDVKDVLDPTKPVDLRQRRDRSPVVERASLVAAR